MFFGGVPLWHCSIAIQRRIGPKPVQSWRLMERKAVLDMFEIILRGVGDVSRKHLEEGYVSLQYRRPMTPAEVLGLPPRAAERIVTMGSSVSTQKANRP